MKNNNMKYKVLLGILIIMFISIIGKDTYSKYKASFTVNVNTTSAEMICDAEVDNPGTYFSTDGWAYFKIIVKNYDSNNNITKVPIQYRVKVSNKNGSNAYYKYFDQYGNTNDFVEQFTTRNYKFSESAMQSHVINVEVKTDSLNSESVGFNVDVDCFQIGQ